MLILFIFFKISIFALQQLRIINNSSLVLPAYFLLVTPQIEKYLSMQAEDEFIFKRISANLLNRGYFSKFFNQQYLVLLIPFNVSLLFDSKKALKLSTSFSIELIKISLLNSGNLDGDLKL